MLLKYPKDYCVVKVPSLLKKEVDFKGHDGLNILIEAHYNPELHVNNVGELMTLPIRLGTGKVGDSVDSVFSMEGLGAPVYYNTHPGEVRWMSEVDLEVQVGDKVWFKYQAPVQAIKNGDFEKGEDENGPYYLIKVHIRDLFCFEREGSLRGNATWTLIEPDMEGWDDILMPVPELDANGHPKVRMAKKFDEASGFFKDVPETVYLPKEKWIQTKVEPEAKYLKGFVRFVGPPLVGDVFEPAPGDHVVYRKDADFKVDISGQSYFMIKQRHIEAIIEK